MGFELTMLEMKGTDCILYLESKIRLNVPVENTINVLSQNPFCLKASVIFPTASSMADTIPVKYEGKNMSYITNL